MNFTFNISETYTQPIKPCIEVLNRTEIMSVIGLNLFMILFIYFYHTHQPLNNYKYKLELLYLMMVVQIVMNVLLIFSIF